LAGQQKINIIDSQKMGTLWVSFTILDAYLHKTALLNILQQLSKNGHKQTLLAVRSKNALQNEQAQIQITSIPIRSVPFLSPIIFGIVISFFLPIYIIISRPEFVIFDPPEVHILGALPALLISKFTKTKFVLDIRTVLVELTGFRGSLRKFWFSFSVLLAKKLFDGITIITPLMKKEICDNYDLDPNKVGVWTSGVSEELFDPENPILRRETIRMSLGLTEKFVVFYHGVFTATRGLIETAEAVKILKSKYPNVVFYLLGSGPIVPMLKALIQKEDLQENVIIHDPVEQSEVPKFIKMCDVCIVPLPNHPYWRHQSPLKLLEYMAMEKVVILTDIPAHKSVVNEAKCGLYISSVNPTEIAEAIEYAYINKENLEEWGKIGRRIITEKYTWKKVAKDLEEYLLSLNEKQIK
jgi:glycosyltransferase involved in cell wall biosynthesis